MADAVKKVTDTFSSAKSLNGIGGTIDAGKGVPKVIKSDIEDEIWNFVKSCLNKQIQKTSQEAICKIALDMIKADFKASRGDNYAQNLGIENLNLNNSKVSFGSNGEISLVATYSVNVQVPFLDTPKKIELQNVAVIKNVSGVSN